MEKLKGIAASGGIAAGKVMLYRASGKAAEKRTIEDVSAETARLDEARAKALSDLNRIYLKSLKLVGEEDSMIFQIHKMMMEDEDYYGSIKSKITKGKVCAEYAVQATGDEFAEKFANMDSEYMRGRKTDVIDISKRLIRCLTGETGEGGLSGIKEPCIVAAEELTPSETIGVDKSKILSIITKNGSKSSHSAILSRTMGIPSVVGLSDAFASVADGMEVIVDGSEGAVITEPSEETLELYRKKEQGYTEYRRDLEKLAGEEAVTKDGRRMRVNANIGSPSDVGDALRNGADGIGLFRSEFLYMKHEALPTEDEQFAAYREVLEKMDGRPVIIRTLDIGADKKVPYLNLPKEENPALGYRAIRICLDRRELFRTQLRALMRASAYGTLLIMFPMIISVSEIREAKKELENVKAALKKENIPFDPGVKAGIMIETPAAAVQSGEFAHEADFFSIGTNDLTQYTLAADRMNDKISAIYDQRHPAVLKLIEYTVGNAKKAGITAGICGESAADTGLTEFYLKIGVDELSVAASSILEVKKKVLSTDLRQ
ncbi:MAG TPA: phosphoenolpyruvate--protein phosphotransferase [Ruminococcaceae bacterium]|nr:phosphoenolpyruvate--protein phosphotransferase [Oscillospiraceae bacterium]